MGKIMLNGVDYSSPSSSGVAGVKGNAESAYRTGNVNITPANIGLGNVDNTADASKNVASAKKLNTSAGSPTNPVYFSNGVPVSSFSLRSGPSAPSSSLGNNGDIYFQYS